MTTRMASSKYALYASVASGSLMLSPVAQAADLTVGNGSHVVSGSGETWDHVVVGSSNGTNGTLSLNSGATLNSGTGVAYGMIVGDNAGSAGTVNVTGASTTWTDGSTRAVVGYSGTGTLNVSDGATVSVQSLNAAYDTGSTGTVTVSGSGSKLTSSEGMTFGVSVLGSAPNATSSLTVKNGATLETVSSDLYIKSGTLTVTGAGTVVNVGTAHGGMLDAWTDSDGWFMVGNGTATVSDGAKIEADGIYVEGTSDGAATMTVSGAGTTLISHLPIYVGGNGNGTAGDGTLTLSGGATASGSTFAAGVDTGTTGTILLTGSGTSLSTVAHGSFLGNGYVGADGTGTVTVQKGATLSVANELRIAYGAGSTGTLVIGAAAGETPIAAGSVSAAGGIVFGSGTGTLIFSHTDSDYRLDSAISGNGSIRHLAGTTELDGTSSGFTGTLAVEGGTLFANGTLSNAVASVSDGAILGGTGTLGSLTVNSGGTHAPGKNGIGTQTIGGDYTLASGSTLKVDVSGSGGMDKVVVGGSVNLTGSALSVTNLGGTYGANSYSQVIIDNGGASAVIGSFASVSDDLAFYDAAVSYDGGGGNDVTLTLTRNATSYADVAATPNQRSVAGALGALSSSSDLLSNILSLTPSQAQSAYTQLSGNIYPTTGQVNLNLNQQVGRQVGVRLASLRAGGGPTGAAGLALSALQMAGFTRTVPASGNALGFVPGAAPYGAQGAVARQARSGVWSQAVGGSGRIEGDANTAETKYNWLGLISGWDTAITPDLTVGTVFGYIKGTSKQSDIRSSVDTDTIMAGLYGEYRVNAWHANAQLGWGRIDADSRRDINIGSFVHTARANYIDQTLSVEGEIARTIDLGNGAWMEPYAGASAMKQFLGHFAETGADTANLERNSDTMLTGNTKLGLRLATELNVGEGNRLMPQFGLAWKHHVGSRGNSSTLHFTSGGSDFVINGTPKDRDALVTNIGAAATFGNDWQTFAAYSPTVSSKQTEHSFILGVRCEF